MPTESPYTPDQQSAKEVVFTNPNGLTVYRYVPSTTTPDEVRSCGLVISNGIEDEMRQHELNSYDIAEHFVIPPMYLPIHISNLSMEELQAQIQQNSDNFAKSTGKIIVSQIPWEKLLSGEINLYTNAPFKGAGENMVRIVPRKNKDGTYVIRRVSTDSVISQVLNRKKLHTSLADRFTGRSLNTTNGEYAIAAPNPHASSIFDEMEDLIPHLAGSLVKLIEIENTAD